MALMTGAYFISVFGHLEAVSVLTLLFLRLVWWLSDFCVSDSVTIAVDSYGPVTDNAQSIFGIITNRADPGIKEEIEKDYGFTPDFELGKHYLKPTIVPAIRSKQPQSRY